MKKLNPTTFGATVKDDPEDGVSIEVGDSKQPDFKPQLKIMRWDNEVNFSMRAEEEVGATLVEEGGVIKYKAKDYEVHQYEKPELEEGGFEFEWVLNKKPKTNILTTTIQSKGLKFYYQPELTQEEIAEGVQRPESVIGSYAVYHETKSNHKVGDKNYKCGKAFHIYRPKAIDANGAEVWAELNITGGILSVTVPQTLLDTATYPVRVDPTFGYTSVGALQSTNSTDFIRTRIGNPGESGTVNSISYYAKANAGNLTLKSKGAIYRNSDGALQTPQTNEVTINSATEQWWTATIDGGLAVSNQDYHVAFLVDSDAGTADTVLYRDTGGVSGDSRSITTGITYPTFPDPLSGGETTNIYSIYATYTASGGVTPVVPISNTLLMGV